MTDTYDDSLPKGFKINVPKRYSKKPFDRRKEGRISLVRVVDTNHIIQVQLYEAKRKMITGFFVFDSKEEIQYFKETETVE